ncbi:hypothetical protein [Paraburkholderia sp. BCC1885]|jgi:hypothetical protein|uniref:hypothetical protein n=1 Tax=Paraburkholderia sp. BCC1885 TaxID=2562669 RepID=UPI001181FD97|nr:hypothetical protein [Paraburkholderia sp. BCC1885]
MNAFSQQAVNALGGTSGQAYLALEAEIAKSPTLMNEITTFAAGTGLISIGVSTSGGGANADLLAHGGGNDGNDPVVSITPAFDTLLVAELQISVP